MSVVREKMLILINCMFDVRDKTILIDAEYWNQQPAIDFLTHALMFRFNREGRAIIHGTVQAYLRGSDDRLLRLLKAAEESGVSYGLKLVRGAYMETERKRSMKMSVPPPIQFTIEDSHVAYDACARHMARRILDLSGRSSRLHPSLWLATHNKESISKVLDQLMETEDRSCIQNKQFTFAQLKGMCDSLSAMVADQGLSVSKYVPFGPIDEVAPYLARRIQENSAIGAASAHEVRFIIEELRHRINGSSKAPPTA